MIKILDPSKCCGCSSCLQVCPKQCISFKEDAEGFKYPSIDTDLCIDCRLCEKVCPILNIESKRVPLQILAARINDEKVLLESSSGGIFFLVAKYVINHGGVVFGAKFNEKWEVVHSYTDSIDEIALFQRSKYVQSIIGNTYLEAKQFLKDGKIVLFTGTPCQIAGLNKYISKKTDNLITMDFVCHGVPSPMVWRDYLKETVHSKCNLSNEDWIRQISGISFRDKSFGWRRFCLNISGPQNNHIITKECLDENPYMRAFLHNIILRPSCYTCPFKNGKSGADITIADYWGCEIFHPSFNDNKGLSLIMLFTKKGKDLIHNLNLNFEISSYRKAVFCNSAIVRSHHKHPNRELFFRFYNEQDSVINWINRCENFSYVNRFIVSIQQLIDKISRRIRYYASKD